MPKAIPKNTYPINFFQIFKFDFENGQDFELGQRHLEHSLVVIQLLAQLVDVVQLRSSSKQFRLANNAQNGVGEKTNNLVSYFKSCNAGMADVIKNFFG